MSFTNILILTCDSRVNPQSYICGWCLLFIARRDRETVFCVYGEYSALTFLKKSQLTRLNCNSVLGGHFLPPPQKVTTYCVKKINRNLKLTFSVNTYIGCRNYRHQLVCGNNDYFGEMPVYRRILLKTRQTVKGQNKGLSLAWQHFSDEVGYKSFLSHFSKNLFKTTVNAQD